MKVGDRLGRFELVRSLGKGSHGVVFEARDTMLGERVALKALHPWLSTDPTLRERFKRELILTRRVSHPGVCRLYDLHEEDGHLFISMQYVDGRTLASVIKGEPIDEQRCVVLMRGICAPLAVAHDAGVMHRDLKPGNVLVGDNDRVVVVDFGIATAAGLGRVTTPGQALGSVPFIPPEVWDGAPASPLGDQYAVGVIAFATLTRELPFNGKSPIEVVDAIRSTRPSVRAKAPGVSAALEAVILRAIAVRPADRYPDIAALEAAFAAALLSTPLPADGGGAIARPTTPATGGAPLEPLSAASGDVALASDAAPDVTGAAGAAPIDAGAGAPPGNPPAGLGLDAPPAAASTTTATTTITGPWSSGTATAARATVESPPSGVPGRSPSGNDAAMASDGPASPVDSADDAAAVVRPAAAAAATFAAAATQIIRRPVHAPVGDRDPRPLPRDQRLLLVGGGGLAAVAVGLAFALSFAPAATVTGTTAGADGGADAGALPRAAGDAGWMPQDTGSMAPQTGARSDAGADAVADVSVDAGAVASTEADAGDAGAPGADADAARPPTRSGPAGPVRVENRVDAGTLAALRQTQSRARERGLRPGDVPAFDGALGRAQLAVRDRNRAGAASAVAEARRVLDGVVVDRAFVSAKLARFNRAFDGKAAAKTEPLKPLTKEVLGRIGRKDWIGANELLNEGFSRLEQGR